MAPQSLGALCASRVRALYLTGCSILSGNKHCLLRPLGQWTGWNGVFQALRMCFCEAAARDSLPLNDRGRPPPLSPPGFEFRGQITQCTLECTLELNPKRYPGGALLTLESHEIPQVLHVYKYPHHY